MTKMGSSASMWNGRNIVLRMTAPNDQSCLSCSAYKLLFPTGSSSLSLFFFFNKMTGAYVSGRRTIMVIVHTPAKIIVTQNTHLQETGLSTMLKREICWVYAVQEKNDILSRNYGSKHCSDKETVTEKTGCKPSSNNGPNIRNNTYQKHIICL